MSNSFLDSASSLYISTGRQSCNKFLSKFLNLKIRPYVLRVTGGCLMEEEYSRKLVNLQNALSGRGKSDIPRFAGFCLFGGTRMIYRESPRKFVRGITEVVPPLSKYCWQAQSLGIVAKVGDLKHSPPHGLIVSPTDPSDPHVTIIHPLQDSVMIVQPSADHHASWVDEYKECIDIMDYLRAGAWQGLMIVYNGGSVVAEEIEAWAENGLRDPFWRVLLVRGSGRSADKYAGNEQFLADHPTVSVCDNTEKDIRRALIELGALISYE